MTRISNPQPLRSGVEGRTGLLFVCLYLGLNALAVVEWGKVASAIALDAADLGRSSDAALDGTGLE